MRVVAAAAVAVTLAGCATPKPTPWSQPTATARASILEYCHGYSGDVSQFCETFKRAMSGDSAALHSVLVDPVYQGQDTSFGQMVPVQLLVITGDERFAAFLGTQSPADRDQLVASVGPGVDTTPQEETYFRSHYPKTYSLWKDYGPFSEHTIRRMREEFRVQHSKKA